MIDITVSICCIAYNHEQFIQKTLDSFLMQEVDFKYEILINDDCSTDNTAKIIQEYQMKYPNIVKPLFQESNQYSKGKKPNPTFNFPRAQGEFVAICEGDDYWTDPKKLQKQVDMMRQYPEVNISFHSAMELVGEEMTRQLAKHTDSSKVFSPNEVILGNGDFCPTASIMMKTKAVQNLPQWFYDVAPVGDYYFQMLTSLEGGALYIDECMCVYRRGHSGNWTSTQKDEEKRLGWLERTIAALDHLNDDTNAQYKKEIQSIQCQSRWTFVRNKNFSYKTRKEQYTQAFHCLSFRRKISGFIKVLGALFKS